MPAKNQLSSDTVTFLVDARIAPAGNDDQVSGGPELHWGGTRPPAAVAITKQIEEVTRDWTTMSRTVSHLAVTMDQPSAGMELQQIELKLAFTAEGKLAFIASAGIDASLTLTFARSGSG